MERQFRINWPVIVEEAKQRRKSQRLTQQHLAKLAGVSTPTVSRFERGEKDIQLSSAMSILRVLGIMDERTLEFPDAKGRYRWDQEAVFFVGKDGDKSVPCAISQEALMDHFEGDEKDPAKVFRRYRERIEHEARRKYLSGRLESDGLVLITTNDL
ncbi:MAG: DUF1488 family protein [Hyphomicrobiales bacterium]|nr:DUF1488 family protein [Hyphomicrobiales bacterium]